jgi:hypothetical protein
MLGLLDKAHRQRDSLGVRGGGRNMARLFKQLRRLRTGGLNRALKIRDTLGLGSDGREEFAFDPDSGVSREEQKEIRREIEQVANQSRIKVSPEMFVVKAAKRGVLFPIVVNVAALVALAAGLGVLYLLFQQGESQAAREDTTTITAEGKLLEEVKKESEARLQEKNAQIGQIQSQLADIDKQRQDLQSNMDAKVQARESQLRAAMAAELDAEKTRLQRQGLSDQDIQKRLADLEAQKNSAFTTQLDAFKTQADAERKKSEAALQDLRAQFNSDLAKANADRQQVLADSRQKEADLQAQLAQKTQELQSAQAQTQTQLAALTSQKQQEDLVSQQLVGLYSVAQADIAAKNYAKALQSLQAIGAYVNSADVALLPAMAKRRPVDLFIVDSLTGLVQGEMDKGKVDTASLVDADNRITDVRALVTNADNLLRAGNVAEAETAYGQALNAIPEIAKSYAYFTGKAKDAETARQDVLRAGLVRAEAAFAAGRYPEMLVAYRDALAYLPENPARLAAAVSNIGTAGEALAVQKAQTDQTRAAVPAFIQANDLLQKHQYSDAAAQFLTVLQGYPRSAQASLAVKGINDSIAGLTSQVASDLKGQSSQVAALKAQLAAVQSSLDSGMSEIAAFKKSAMALLGQSGDLSTTDSASLMSALEKRFGDLSSATGASADLQRSLEAATKRSADLSAQVTRLSSENARLAADLTSSRQDAERQRQLAAQAPDALRGGQPGSAAAAPSTAGPASVSSGNAKALAEFEKLAAGYIAYTRLEDANLKQYGQQKALMLTVGSRDSFLASLGKVFDGILGRVKRYEAQSSTDGIDTGRKGALDDVAALMTSLANQKTVDAQKSFLDTRLAAERDPRMKSVIAAVLKVVSSR